MQWVTMKNAALNRKRYKVQYIQTTRTGTQASNIADIQVPDVHNLAEHIRGTGASGDQDAADIVMDLWMLANDLTRALQHAEKIIEQAMNDDELFEMFDYTEENEAL